MALPILGKRGRLCGCHTLGTFAAEVKYWKQKNAPVGAPTGAFRPKTLKLLDFHRRASGFERRLGLVGVGLGDLLEDGLGGTVDEILGFL